MPDPRSGTALRTVPPQARAGLRVRLVTWDDDPPVGGQGIYARELRAALTRRGVEVATSAGRGAHAVPYQRLTGRGHLDMSVHLNAEPAGLLRGEPDVLHVSGGPGGLQLLRRVPVPVVYTAHHTYRQAHRRLDLQRVVSPLEAAAYRRAAVVAAVSADTAQAVISLGVPAHRVRVIPPGVHLAAPAGPVERAPGRMLFVGRLEAEKGPLDAFTAMQGVMAEMPSARGVFVGTGSLEPQLRALVEADERFTWRSRISDEELAAEYHRAQVVLMPSQYEGLGLVALEAMAAGAAVVGYDVTGLRDAIGTDGVLVPAGNVAELATACRRLLHDDARRDDVTGRAAVSVRERFSWDRCAADFAELYREVVDRP